MTTHPITLSMITERTGFTMSDVAFLAGLSESTLSRLWDDPRWLDRISGKTLQALVSALPGVGECLINGAVRDRRANVAHDLTQYGVTVKHEGFSGPGQDSGIPEQYLSHVLAAALPILAGDVDRSAALLARFWGREQDNAFGCLLGTETRCQLLLDPGPLITAARGILHKLMARTNSFHAVISQAVLSHHLARLSGDLISLGGPVVNRQSALSCRSLMIGRMIATDDLDTAGRYCSMVRANHFLSAIDEWSFLTYSYNARMTHDFSLPRSLALTSASHEMLREIGSENDAYLYYLMTTLIPAVLRRDPSFGGHLRSLRKSIADRIAYCDPAVRQSCVSLLKQLDSYPPALEEPHDDYCW